MERIEENNASHQNREENSEFTLLNDINEVPEVNYENFELNAETFSSCKDNEEIYSLLCKIAYTKAHVEMFKKFFYGQKDQNSEFKSKEFTSVGIFEDISYLPLWTNNAGLTIFADNIREKEGVGYWRRIKGDGNCYYRAIMINYVELLILNSFEKKNPEIFFSLIKDIIFTEFPKDKVKQKKLSMVVFIAIFESLTQAVQSYYEDDFNMNLTNESNYAKDDKPKIYKSFDILYRAYNKSDIIEKLLIFWFRLKLTNFLKKNLDLEFNGLKLVQCIPGFELEDDLTYDKNSVFKYIDNDLVKMNEYVEGYPLYITSILLKVDLNIFFIDDKNNPYKVDLKYYGDINESISPIEDFLFDLKNSKYENEINVLFQVPHYDTLYKHSFVEKIMNCYTNPNAFVILGQMDESEYNHYKSEVLGYIRSSNRSNNPLYQVLSGQEVKPTFNYPQMETKIVIDLNNVNLNDEDTRGERNFKPVERNKASSICVSCLKEIDLLIYYPCKHSFCLNCFEKNFDTTLNNKTKKNKYRIKEIRKIDEIIKIMRDEKKYKYVKCLAGEDCPKSFGYSELEQILENFFYFSSGGKPKFNDKNYSNGDKNPTKKSAYCKPCQTYTELVILSDGCEVCIDCQKKKIFKENGKNVQMVYDRSRLKPNKCLKCMKLLKFADYSVIFKSNSNNNLK